MDDQPALPILEVPSLLNSPSPSPSRTHISDLPEDLISNLPKVLIVKILLRLYLDDLACIRVVSRAFFDIVSTEVRSVNLLCPLDRYTNSGQPITPFKKIVMDLIFSMGAVFYISIGVEERANHKSLDKKLDDLHLTEVRFVYPWLERVCEGLISLSISNYRKHSRGKWSEVLSLISFKCPNLHELVLKNAWLSTYGLNPMRKLTSLTLAFVKLDDKDLSKVNSCCPSLQILKLIMVEGLEKPQINYLHLRTCRYVPFISATLPLIYVRNYVRFVELTSVTQLLLPIFADSVTLPLIHAPNLTRLEFGYEPQIDKITSYKVDLGPEFLSAPLSIGEILMWALFDKYVIENSL